MSIYNNINGVWRNASNENPDISGFSKASIAMHEASSIIYIGYMLGDISYIGSRQIVITKNNVSICKGTYVIQGYHPQYNPNPSITLSITEGALPSFLHTCSFGQHTTYGMHFYTVYAYNNIPSDYDRHKAFIKIMIDLMNHEIYYK